MGKYDIGDGLPKLLQETYKDTLSLMETAQSLQIGLLVGACAMNVFYFARYFRVWLSIVTSEGKRVAQLLSELPQELSVERILQEAFAGTTKAAAGGAGKAARVSEADSSAGGD